MGHPNPHQWPKIDDRQRERTIARMHRKIKLDDKGCWIWQGPKPNGYGRTSVGGVSMPTHRATYFLYRGPFDRFLDLDHLCRTPACCNPYHVEPVTPRENVLRGETLPADQLTRTHCPQGHPYSGDNLYERPSGRRACKACQREWTRAYNERKKAS